jgi:hypothetical protein
MLVGLLPVVDQRGSRIHYAIPFSARLLASAGALAVAGTGFLLPDGAGSLPRGLWWATALVLALAALSEDRWTFDTAARAVRRRFGLLFPARTWSLPLDEVESFALIAGDPSDIGRRAAEARSGGEAMGGGLGQGARSTLDERIEAEDLDQRERLAVSLQGMGRGPWIALVMRLTGERVAVLASSRRRLGAKGGPSRAATVGGPSRAEAKLREDGRNLGRLVGLPFLDALEE